MESHNIVDVIIPDSNPSDSHQESTETTLTVSAIQDDCCDHRCYPVLLTRRKSVKNKAYRIYMMKEVINQSVKMYMPFSMRSDFTFLHWHHKTSAFVAKPRNWTNKKLAEAICTFDKILTTSQKVDDKLIVKYPPAISHFISYMIEIFKEAEIVDNENIQSTKGKLVSQKGQSCLQDNVDMTSLNDRSFDVNSCAYCKHKFIIPIGLDVHAITRFNSRVNKSHLEKMKEWSNTPTKKEE